MVYAKALCFDCRGIFEIHASEMTPDREPPTCPHCGAVLPEKAFRKLENVTLELAEINKDLRNAADTDGATLFSLDLLNYHPRSGTRPRRYNE